MFVEIWRVKAIQVGSDRDQARVIRRWGKGNPCSKVAKNLAELCSSSSSTEELVSDEIAYLAEVISKQSVEGVALVPPDSL